METGVGSAAVTAGTALAEMEGTKGAACWDGAAAGLAVVEGCVGKIAVAAEVGRRGSTAAVDTAAVCAVEDEGTAAAAAGEVAGADEAEGVEAG